MRPVHVEYEGMTRILEGRGKELLVHGETIADIHIRRIETWTDPRGSFTEFFSADWNTGLAPKQWSLVQSEADTCRGMHVHRYHDECYLLFIGAGYLGLHDIREGSPTERRSMMLGLSGNDLYLVQIARGILHGWFYTAGSMHLQGVTRTYNAYHPDDNLGCKWSDPELDLPWPGTCRIMSERSKAFPPLRELLAEVKIPYGN
jgi:dTDP-4-dehydrorhamnose 3,5-epimerase